MQPSDPVYARFLGLPFRMSDRALWTGFFGYPEEILFNDVVEFTRDRSATYLLPSVSIRDGDGGDRWHGWRPRILEIHWWHLTLRIYLLDLTD